MDLYERILESAASPDVKLLCQIPINDMEYDELLNFAQAKVSNLHYQTIFDADVCLAVTMVQIAIREYTAGNYWNFFLDVMNKSISRNKLNWIGQIFMATLRKYGLFELERETGSITQYVENIKAHCFVPDKYLDGYFDFISSFYDRNLFRQIPDDMDEDINEMIEYMSDTLSYNEDSIRIDRLDTDNRPAKTYRLLKATRSVIAQCDASTTSDLISQHLRMVDNLYYDNIFPEEKNRFCDGFINWSENPLFNSELNQLGKKRSSKANEVFYHSPYFEFNRSKGTAYLVIPQQKFREQEFNGKAIVSISCNNINQSFRLNLYRAFGVIISEKLLIPINDIFAEYHIKIQSAITKEFPLIPEKHYRIFNDDGDELHRLKKGHCYILARKGSQLHGNIDPVYSDNVNSNWDEYSYTIEDNTVIYINDIPLSIAGEFSERALFENTFIDYLFYDSNGKEVKASKKHPIASFKIGRQKVGGTLIWFNGQRLKDNLWDIASIIELSNDPDNYGITVALNDLLPLEDGLYSIVVDEPGKGKRLICRYVLIQSLRCRTDKRRYTFCESATLSITGNYDIAPVDCTAIGPGRYIIDLTSGAEKAEFYLSIKDEIFKVLIPLNVFKYGFSQQWIFNQLDYLWYSDLKNDLYVCIPGANKANVVLDRDESFKIHGVEISPGIFKFDIAEFVHIIQEGKKGYPYYFINLNYHDNADRQMLLMRVLRKPWIENRISLNLSSEGINTMAIFKGNAELLFRLSSTKTKQIVTEKKLISGEKTYLPEINPYDLYIAEIFMIESDEFGFSQNIQQIMPPIRNFGVTLTF